MLCGCRKLSHFISQPPQSSFFYRSISILCRKNLRPAVTSSQLETLLQSLWADRLKIGKISTKTPRPFHRAQYSTLQKSPDPSASAVYQPPQKGIISCLPRSWIPYAELIRLDKPTGTYYLFLPCIFSTLMAASYTGAAPSSVLATMILFLTGALVMRGAGCTINDLWDRNLDSHVARTRLRPIARGAVSPFNASVFAGLQMLVGLGVLLQFPPSCLYYGIPSLLLVATYPLAKRFTHYPQFVLGLAFLGVL